MRFEHARIIHGYHGCDAKVARELLNGASFKASENDYDWLGRGIYFWEYGPDRAMRFAEFQRDRGHLKIPAVVGAVIHLGNCFDLLDTRFTRDLAEAFPLFEATVADAGAPMPLNRGSTPDRKLRKLDCAVMNWYLDRVEQKGRRTYDTVRGCFREGVPVFPGSGIYDESHIQIAVRNPECIIGTFRPTMYGR